MGQNDSLCCGLVITGSAMLQLLSASKRSSCKNWHGWLIGLLLCSDTTTVDTPWPCGLNTWYDVWGNVLRNLSCHVNTPIKNGRLSRDDGTVGMLFGTTFKAFNFKSLAFMAPLFGCAPLHAPSMPFRVPKCLKWNIPCLMPILVLIYSSTRMRAGFSTG